MKTTLELHQKSKHRLVTFDRYCDSCGKVVTYVLVKETSTEEHYRCDVCHVIIVYKVK
jgi:DNA-directed RNA polymerase subunit RPC12/RpoP